MAFFDGRGLFSSAIRTFTGVPTHVGLLRQCPSHPSLGPLKPCYSIQLYESTTLNRFSGRRGVQLNPLSDIVAHQRGTVWIALLSQEVREAIEWRRWQSYLDRLIGKPYDYAQAIGSAIGQWLPLIPSRSLKRSFFCSEMAAGTLRESGAVPSYWDQTPTPYQLAKWNVFQEVIRVSGPDRSFPQADPIWTPPQIAANRL